MAQYQDIYMRDYVGDTGQVPSDTRMGVSQSPDIIPYGPNPDTNYQADFAANYNGPFGYIQNVNPAAYNYIYVRGFNAFPTAQTGSINLYWSPASLLLWPQGWIANRIANTNGTQSATIASTAPNTVCVGRGAFYWHPGSLSAGDHFCLISQVVTQQDPNVFPTTIADFAQWVANNANIAWRNVNLVSAPAPQYSAFVSMQNPVAEVNQFTLTVTCTAVPDGAVVSLVGSEPSPLINFNFTVGPTNQTGTNPKVNQYGWTVFNVPGLFQEALQLSTTSAASLPGGASITYTYYWLVQRNHPLAHLGVEPAQFNMQGEAPGVADQGVMIPLGDYTFQF